MDETRLAVRALLDDHERDDWNELRDLYRSLRGALFETGRKTRKDRARVAEHLRKAGRRPRHQDSGGDYPLNRQTVEYLSPERVTLAAHRIGPSAGRFRRSSMRSVPASNG